jgi:hypothetical protein
MDDIEENPIFSANTSPAASPQVHNNPTNPFYHPADDLSPMGDSQEQQTAVMGESSQPPTPSAHSEKGKGASQPERPTLMASMSSFTNPPPPKPLGLPPPRTPPPPINSSPPTPIASPTLTTASQEQKEPKETRWWHDWLCGLTEGSDRGGNDQVCNFFPSDVFIVYQICCFVSRLAGPIHLSNIRIFLKGKFLTIVIEDIDSHVPASSQYQISPFTHRFFILGRTL